MIAWQDSYSTGVEELDKQHRDLFKYTNDLEQLLKDNSLSKNLLDDILRLLNRYIEVHFNREETCMHKHLCPIANKNKDAHQKFIHTFKMMEIEIRTNIEDDAPIIKLHHFLETWLVEHICKIDVQLKPCIHHP